MHFKVFSGWLLLAPVLTSSLAAYAEQEVLAPWEPPSETFEPITIGKPHHPHHEEPVEHADTIYQVLANEPSFSLITKAVNFVEDIAALLNDSSSQLTFFAPPDRTLRRPPGSPPPGNLTSFGSLSLVEGADDSLVTLISQYRDITDLLPFLEELDNGELSSAGEEDDKRKKIFKIILRAILSYHIVPGIAYDQNELGKNVTYPTHLQIPGAFDGEPLRLRVSRTVLPPAIHVNFVSKIIHPDIKASNGFVQVVSHALLPPPSVFQELYFIPSAFATLTSALQRSNLTDDLDLRYVHGHGLEGTSLVTIFAPTNRAFESLPRKLQLFLFSPFGERVLKKLLQYHIVPNAVIHSNYIHGDIAADALDQDSQDTFDHLPHHNHAKPKLPVHVKPVFSLNLTATTLLENHTLTARIIQSEVTFPTIPGHKKPSIINTKVIVNGRPAVLADVVSLNGAIHVVNKVLDPRKHHHGGHHGGHRHPGHHHERPSHAEDALESAHHRGLAFEPLFGGLNGADVMEESRHHGPPGSSGPCSKGCETKGRGRRGGCSKRDRKDGHEEPEHKHGRKDDGRRPPPPRRPSEDQPGRSQHHPHHHESFEEANFEGHSLEHDDWVDWESWLPQWAEQD